MPLGHAKQQVDELAHWRARLGITAKRHTVVANLMNEVLKTAAERGRVLRTTREWQFEQLSQVLLGSGTLEREATRYLAFCH